MAAKTWLWCGCLGLWLLATLAVGSASAQNLYVGPGTVVIQQYRPGVSFYSPYIYPSFVPNPFVYVPLTGTRVQIYSAPRIQPYAVPSLPSYAAPSSPSYGVPSNPSQPYYTPYIPPYHRSEKASDSSDAKPAPTSQAPTDDGPNMPLEPAVSVPIPVPGQAEEAGQKEEVKAPTADGEQMSAPGADQSQQPQAPARERTSKSARRKPIRYR
jgi:hypothetical protein